MSDKREKKVIIDEEFDFCWGKKRGRGGKNKEFQFYDSFMFDGVEYCLYDSVYLFKVGECEPFVGKILKLWEHKTMGRKVKVLWFFRPSEVSNYLQGVKLLNNELFLATGEGPGLTNINPLEAIAGKCNVVCISKDDRNKQPLVEEIKNADYVFYRTFDVQKLTVSDKLDEKIANVDVKSLLNKNDPQLAALQGGVEVAVDIAMPLIAANDTLADDRLVDPNITSAVKADGMTRDLVQKCHSSEKLGTILVMADERRTMSTKDAQDVDGNVKSGAGLGPSLVREEKQSLEKSTSFKNNKSLVPSFQSALESGQETTSNSSDLRQTDLKKVSEGAVALARNLNSEDNGNSERVSDVKRRIAVAGNLKSEDKLSKKLIIDDSARKTITNGGTGTQNSVIVSPASNKGSEPAGSAVENNAIGKLKRQSGGINDTAPKKQKHSGTMPPMSEKTSDKSNKPSGKQSKDLRNSVNKAPLPPSGASECNVRGKLSRERDGTSEDISKKRKTNSLIEPKLKDRLGKMSNKQPSDDDNEIGAYNQVKKVTQRPSDKSKWFTASPWEDRMKDGCDQGRLVLLQNLDPTYNSIEVENIVWHGFGESCTAQIVQRTATSSPHSGQAFVIFNNQRVALEVVGKLERDCLMLPNGRPLVGKIYTMSLPAKQPQYFGHLTIEKVKHQTQKEMREAVSTSHAAQSNTIEFEMALEWRLLQERSNLWWQCLYQKQGEEMRKLKANLKSQMT